MAPLAKRRLKYEVIAKANQAIIMTIQRLVFT